MSVPTSPVSNPRSLVLSQSDAGAQNPTIILLVDQPLKKSQSQLLHKLFSVIEFNPKWHTNKSIDEIESGDFFVIDISPDSLFKRSSGIKFFEINRKLFDDDRYKVVYYRTVDYVRKDNLCRLGLDARVVELPKNVKSKDEYLFVLLSDKMPQVRSFFTRLFQTFTKKK